MSRLTGYITSDYINAANKLKKNGGRRRIIAYVESYDDIFFWRAVLSRYENDNVFFEVMLPSHKSLAKGKKTVLMNIMKEQQLGSNIIACVDADYDFLMQGATPMSKMIIDCPYVFHTYAYAIENLQCYAPSLHNVCVSVTLNDNITFDFVSFMQQYSEAIFPLFIWSIWFYRHNDHSFTITDFNQIINTGNFREYDTDDIINNVRRKVGVRIRQFHRQYPNAKDEWLALKDEIKSLGVAPADTYLYIQGHHLYDALIVPMLKRICDRLILQRETEITRMATHVEQKNNELAGYSHCLADINMVLRRNTDFFSSTPYQLLNRDLKQFIRQQQRADLPASPSKEVAPQR